MGHDKFSTVIKGAIGEFYVASYLSALNLVVALPRGGVPSSDLLVTTPKGNKTISMQVKTATSPRGHDKDEGPVFTWHVSNKAREAGTRNHWYVFVDLNGWPESGNLPELFFVSSEDVAEGVNSGWNKSEATMIFFPIIERKNAANYRGLEGFNKMKVELMG